MNTPEHVALREAIKDEFLPKPPNTVEIEDIALTISNILCKEWINYVDDEELDDAIFDMIKEHFTPGIDVNELIDKVLAEFPGSATGPSPYSH